VCEVILDKFSAGFEPEFATRFVNVILARLPTAGGLGMVTIVTTLNLLLVSFRLNGFTP
jgi:hypothetical protein